jgi:hypothetical protein
VAAVSGNISNPPASLPHHTTRMKIGQRTYFLTAEPPVVDAVTGTTIVYLHVQPQHAFGGKAFNADGAVYELTKIDPGDFQADPNWRAIGSPFADLA